MKTKQIIAQVLLILAGVVITAASPKPSVYVGANPCGDLVKQMLKIPADKKCDMMKWELSLFQGFPDDHPAYFTLSYNAGLSKNGTRGFQEGTYTSKLSGVWTVKPKPTGLPGRDIIELQSESGEKLTLIRLDDNVLYLLDFQHKMMVGNGGFGYNFNKR